MPKSKDLTPTRNPDRAMDEIESIMDKAREDCIKVIENRVRTGLERVARRFPRREFHLYEGVYGYCGIEITDPQTGTQVVVRMSSITHSKRKNLESQKEFESLFSDARLLLEEYIKLSSVPNVAIDLRLGPTASKKK